jgi:hypothetical protein
MRRGAGVAQSEHRGRTHMNTGKVKFFNEAKGWVLEAAVKWVVAALLSHFQ